MMIYTLLSYATHHFIIQAYRPRYLVTGVINAISFVTNLDLEISDNIHRGKYIATVEQWSTVLCHRAREWSPIFFSPRLSLQGWLVFYASQLVDLTPPPKISTYRTWKKRNESGKGGRWEWKGPKRGLRSPFRLLCKVAPPPPSLFSPFLCLPFRHKCFSLCIRPNSISFRWRLPLRSDFADGARREKVSGGILIQDRKFTAS